MEKVPGKVKVIYGILIFKLLLMLAVIVVFYLVKDIPSGEQSAGGGIRDGMVNSLGEDSRNTDYVFGYLCGTMLIPILATILSMVFVRKRMFIPLVVTVALDLVISFSSVGFPILQIITLALIFSEPAKSYLKKAVKEDFTNDFGKPDVG